MSEPISYRTSSSSVVIETGRLRLRPYKDEDFQALVAWAGDWEVASWLTNVPHPYGDEFGRNWIAHVRRDHASGRPRSFAVALKDGDELIGNCGLDGVLRGAAGSGTAALGYWLGRPYWGQGYGSEAARAVIGYGLDELGIDVIQASTHPENVASQKILLACGLNRVGDIELANPMRRGGRHCPLFAISRSGRSRSSRSRPSSLGKDSC